MCIQYTNKGMFTTRKYRFLWSLYLLSQLLDTTMLVLLVTSLFFPHESEGRPFDKILGDNWEIFFALALEIFLNVLETQVRIWILNRLSIYLHLTLYGLYAISFFIKDIWSTFVIALFFIRLFAFIVGTLIDFAIDLEVDFDLKGDANGESQIHKLSFINTFARWLRYFAKCDIKNICKSFCDCLICKCCCPDEPNNEDTEAKIALQEWEYQGSLFIWSCKNAYTYKPKEANECKCKCCIKNGHRLIFNIMFFVIYAFAALPIMMIVFCWIIILAILRMFAILFLCRCCFNNNNTNDGIIASSICGECIKHHIY